MIEVHFMHIVGFLIAVYLAYLILSRFIKIPPIRDIFNFSDFITKSTLKEIIKSKEIIKRLLFTLFIIIIFRLLCYVPLPGLNIDALRHFFERTSKTAITFVFGDNIYSRLSVTALGVMPYISACMLLQLLSIFIKPLKRFMFEDATGRRRLVTWTLILSIVISILQAYFISRWLENPIRFQGEGLILFSGLKFRLLATISMVTGFLFTLWLATLINNKGIGNGIPMIILSSIIFRIVAIFMNITKIPINYFNIIAYLIILVITAVIILLVTKSIKKIPLVFNIGSRKEAGLPLRYTWVATMPFVLTQYILFLPVTIASFIPNPAMQKFASFFIRSNFLYSLVYAVLIVVFTYIYMLVVFKPKYIVKLLKRYNCSIFGVEVGSKTEDYLDDSMSKVTLLTGLFLILVALVPDLIMRVFQFPYLMTSILGASGILIAIGIVYDVVEQMKTRLMMEKYNTKWQRIVVLDELEANIKKGYLESHSIPCVIEALRYTWGLPIRTAMDQYRLNIPQEQFKQAEEVLR